MKVVEAAVEAAKTRGKVEAMLIVSSGNVYYLS